MLIFINMDYLRIIISIIIYQPGSDRILDFIMINLYLLVK